MPEAGQNIGRTLLSAQASKERLVGSPSKCRRAASPPRNSGINAVSKLPLIGFARILYEEGRINRWWWVVGGGKGIRSTDR